MANNETRVLYKAIADFTALGRATRKAKKDIADLRKEEALLNSSSVAGSAASTVAMGKHAKAVEADAGAYGKHAKAADLGVSSVGRHTKALGSEVAAFESVTSSSKRATQSVTTHTKAVDTNTTSTRSSTVAHKGLSTATAEAERVSKALTETVSRAAQRHRENASALGVSRHRMSESRTEVKALGGAMQSTLAQAERFNSGLIKIGNWRPRLMPPFIALIPVIGGVLALLNPLVALLGAAGAAGLGLASNLGSIGGAALAAIPGIAALISVVAGLKTAFSGIGNTFKLAAAMKKATVGARAKPEKATITLEEETTRAQEGYRRSVEDVRFAEGELDNTRKNAIQRLKDLKKAVDGAAQSEASARANAQLSSENYANVMADPGSTKGQKMSAKSALDDANNNVTSVIEQAKADASDYAAMKRDGIEGDKAVIMAKRSVVDAINAERDSQINLQNVGKDSAASATSAAGATALYEEALNKLSPSAKSVVMQLLAMSAAWTGVKKAVQEDFFSEIDGSVGSLTKTFPVLTDLLGKASGAMGRVLDRGIKMTTSTKWISDLGIIADQNVPLIESIGDGLFYVLDMLKSVAVAVGPFATALGEGFKNGAKNLSDLMNTDSARSGLASYLDTVLDRMRQWWRIIKNIGKTIFNYSSAAGEFGQWMTDGFEKMTKGWLDASEEAKKKGSPFQKYLEDIKPLLHEVGGLFGDFFKWFAKVSMDPKNITMFTDIVKIFREDLGPALADIFDTLSKSGVGKDFINALVSIIEMIATILDNGGVDAIKGFYGALSGFFDMLKGALGSIPQPVMSAIVLGLGAIAAMEFLGVTSFLGLLFKLGKGGTLANIAKGIGGLFTKTGRAAAATKVGGAADGLPFIGAGRSAGAHAVGGKALPAYAAGATSTRKGALAAEKALAGNTGVWTKLGRVVPRFGKFVAAAALAAPGIAKIVPGITKLAPVIAKLTPKVKGLNFGSALAKGGKGGIAGLVLGVAGDLAGQAISNGASAGKGGAGQRVGGNALSGAAQGAGIGALVGSVVPGVGTAIGAAAGGVIGGAAGIMGSSEEDKNTFFAGIAQGWNDFWGTSLPQFWTDFGTGITNWFTSLGTSWTNFITVDVPRFIGTLAADIEFFFTDTLPTAWNTFWGTTWPTFWGDLGAGWDNFFNVTLPNAWNTFWGTTWPTFWADLGAGWDNFFNVTLPNGWDTYWGTTFPKFWSDFGLGLGGFFTDIGTNWDGYWGETFPQFWEDFAGGIGGFFTDLQRNWNDFWGGVFGNTASAYNDRKTQLQKNKKRATGFLGGGVSGTGIRRANGGSVPGIGANSDTVPAMLTPGEYVIRKSIVNRVGMENLQKFNSGVMSYAEMLRSSMAGASGPEKNKNSGTSFFNGGGLVPTAPTNFGGGSGPKDFPAPVTSNTTKNSGITVENLTVNNPSPEPASQSVSRGLRKMAYFGAMG